MAETVMRQYHGLYISKKEQSTEKEHRDAKGILMQYVEKIPYRNIPKGKEVVVGIQMRNHLNILVIQANSERILLSVFDKDRKNNIWSVRNILTKEEEKYLREAELKKIAGRIEAKVNGHCKIPSFENEQEIMHQYLEKFNSMDLPEHHYVPCEVSGVIDASRPAPGKELVQPENSGPSQKKMVFADFEERRQWAKEQKQKLSKQKTTTAPDRTSPSHDGR